MKTFKKTQKQTNIKGETERDRDRDRQRQREMKYFECSNI